MEKRMISISRYYGSLPGMLRKFDRMARSDAFQGNTPEEWEKWKVQARKRLWNLLGMERMEESPLNARVTEQEEAEPGILRERVLIQVEPETWMPVYILIPRSGGEIKGCFLAPPGHQGAGKYSVAGLSQYGAVAEAIERFNYDYGLFLARLGYVVLCPDARGFGERRDEAFQKDEESCFLRSTCFYLAHMAEPLGMTVAGMCTWDLMRLIDYVQERGEWRTDNLGCLGFSGGGMQTLWLAALDKRVKMAVISGYMYGYKDSLLKLNGNCSCNYVPGLWNYYDCGDIGSLIAPRPLLIQSCTEDHLNGERGIANADEQVEIIRGAYRLLGAENKLIHQHCPGGHRFHKEGIEENLERMEEMI